MPLDSSAFYDELANALRDRLIVIADHSLRAQDPEAQMERLKTVSQRILTLQAKLPANAPARLVHFLENCSYDKALAFLSGGPDDQRGS